MTNFERIEVKIDNRTCRYSTGWQKCCSEEEYHDADVGLAKLVGSQLLSTQLDTAGEFIFTWFQVWF